MTFNYEIVNCWALCNDNIFQPTTEILLVTKSGPELWPTQPLSDRRGGSFLWGGGGSGQSFKPATLPFYKRFALTCYERGALIGTGSTLSSNKF